MVNRLNGVEASELSMVLDGGGVVRLCGFNGSFESPNVFRSAIVANSGVVSPLALGYAFYPSFTVGIDSAVSLVLGVSRPSEIFLAAIESVSVYVVNLIGGQAHNKTVEGDVFAWPSALRDTSHRIKTMPVFLRSPLEATNNVRILVVDYCRLALREFYMGHSKIVPNLTEMETTPPGIKNKPKEKTT